MARQRRTPKPTPSPALRTENWAKIVPPRIRDADQFARQAFLPEENPSPRKFHAFGDRDPWYAPSAPDPESQGEP